MNALLLLLVLNSTLVLHSGDRIPVEGKPLEKDGVLTFRSAGKLYSLPASEVDRVEEAETAGDTAQPVVIEAKKTSAPRRRVVSEEDRRRLLADLEKNHAGTAPLPPPALPPAPTREEAKEMRREESSWRREARSHEETVRRAREEV